MAADMLKKYEQKHWQEVISDGNFPELIKLQSNIDYIRKVLAKTVYNTADREWYTDVSTLSKDADFFKYQKKVNGKNDNDVISHRFIQNYMDKKGSDYRYEIKLNPIAELRDRTCDNSTVGRA